MSGILFVASKVLHPSNIAPLDFADWYENTHIQEVQSTGGISGTQRYESLSFHKQYRDDSSNTAENQNFAYDFLTIYNMEDLAFRESEAFRGLDGQSKPSEELLEKLFKHAAFCTRFCEEINASGQSGWYADPAPFLLSVGIHSDDSADNALAKISHMMRCRRVRRCELREASLLSEFERSYHNEPREVVVMEIDDESALEEATEELCRHERLEVGLWRLRKNYQGSERTPAKWNST